ncbi:hypothetical protein C7974DRAFT_87668 [Boeremia exigua]|uniref:uncharacterized protein n=1 Tax=Boeremia exigua TaxID=749465 RepID=UPI001E8EF323|nr:uncharacterized protein C7974DRAFT_87668 [Boeremia exigua]KAH6611936.1 hypothetical protein C7974DRAFT_87668 [Boeremia exigua]
MAGEAPLSPSQVRRDGRWRPVRHKTAPSIRPLPRTSDPQRRSSLRAVLKRKPLSTISEDKSPSLKSNSTVSLRLNIALPYQSSVFSHSSDHLLYFQPSQQLQNLQSVSFHCTDEAYESMPRLYRTQSQWKTSPIRYYQLSDTPVIQRLMVHDMDAYETHSESGGSPTTAREDLPREAIADLFHRVEAYEREHPEVVRDSGKVWVRVNSVGHGLTKTFKTMSSLRKKQTFEARIGHSVAVQSQLRVYEKPSGTKRLKIAAHDCWRKFRNWSTGKNTEPWAKENLIQNPYRILNSSIVSLPKKRQPRFRKLSRALKLEERTIGTECTRKARRDSKMSIGEQPKRRKSSLFLDVYSSDFPDSPLRDYVVA